MPHKATYAAVFVSLLSSCCPQTYPVQHADTNVATLTNLDQTILLHYKGTPAPTVEKVIASGKQRGRGSTCEAASIKVLKKMQEDAKKVGANAIINLTATWKHKKLISEDGMRFKCKSGLFCHIFGVQWTGDFVVIASPAAGEAAAPLPEPTEPAAP